MNFVYENQGHNTYLVYNLSELEEIDSLSLGMLTNNNIPGLINAVFMQMDLNKYIKYNVSAKISVKQLFLGPVNKKRLLSVFSGIVNAMLSAEEYMINTKMILLDLDYIFTDVSSNETVLIALPVIGSEYKQVPIGSFLKNIMFSTQFDQMENCDYVAKIINHLNSNPVFSLEAFKDLLDSLKDKNTLYKDTPAAPVVNQGGSVSNKINSQPTVNSFSNNIPSTNVTVPEKSSPLPFAKPTEDNKKIPVPNGIGGISSKSPVTPVQPNIEQTDNDEGKSISLFYLLQHFNSENLQTYRTQRANQKIKKNSDPVSNQNSGFAIPGQNSPAQDLNNSFSSSIPAVPSKSVDIPTQGNTSSGVDFDVPGLKSNSSQVDLSSPSLQNSVSMSTSNQFTQSFGNNLSNQSTLMSDFNAQNSFSNNDNFGDTTVLSYNNAGETTVLNVPQKSESVAPYLIRLKSNEKIPINVPVFRIGKERSFVNYFISDNTAISRSHANILTKNSKFFVVDTNSTNHTYLNGEMIPSNSEIEITNGSKIRFANEEFEFKVC